MKFTDLKKHLATEPMRKGYLVIGDDAYLVRRACEMIRAKAVIPELNVSLFNAASEVSDILAALMQLPAMSPVRVVEVDGIAKDLSRLAKFLDDPTPGVTLVLRYNGIAAKEAAAFVGALTVVDCSKLSDDYIRMWMEPYFKKAGKSITLTAANLLITMCARDLARISVECEKLASASDNPTVTDDLVKKLVEPEPEYKIYELSEAIAYRNSAKAFDIYRALFFQMPASAVLSALYSHFRRLLYVAVSGEGSDVARNLGVKDFAVTMARRQAKLFTPKKLKAIVDDLNDLDYKIKSGLIEDRVAADTFVSKMLA